MCVCIGGICFGFQDDVTINFDANVMACNGTTHIQTEECDQNTQRSCGGGWVREIVSSENHNCCHYI